VDPEEFLAAYRDNRDAANEVALEASAVGRAVRALAEDAGAWVGTATDLLEALNERVPKETRPAKGWPTSPRGVSNALRRIQPNLRQVGIVVVFRREEGRKRTRLIELETVGSPASAASATSYQPERADAEDARDAADATAPSVSNGSWSDEPLPGLDPDDPGQWTR
jgi:hypothetical protein